MALAMPPAFRRGWEGEGKPQIDALARASGRQPATRGRLFAVSGTRGRSPWRSRARVAPAIRTHNRHPCDGAKPPDALRARSVRQRASGNERGKSACGSAKKAAPSGAHSAGQSASSGNSRSTVNCTTGIWWSQHTEQATKVYGKDQRPTQW